MKKLLFVCIIFSFLCSITLFSNPIADYRSGMNYLDKGNTENILKSVNFFKKAIEKNPYYFKAMRSLGIAYFKLEYYNLAYKLIKKALIQKENDIETNLIFAEILMKLGKPKAAKKYINYVLSKWPRNIRAIYSDALYYIKIKRYDLAKKRLHSVIAIHPSHYKTYIQLGNINRMNNQNKNAESQYLKAVRCNSTSVWPYYYLGKFYFDQSKPLSAYNYLKKLIRIDPDFKKGLILMGETVFLIASKLNMGSNHQKWEEARSIYHKLVKVYPYNHIFRYTLALIYKNLSVKDRSNVQNAVENFIYALKMKANDEIVRYQFEEFIIKYLPIKSALRKKLSDYHIEVGDMHSRSNLNYRAVVSYKRAIRIYPISITGRKKLSLIYRDTRKWEKFYKQIKILSLIDRHNTVLADRLSFYKNLIDQLISRKNRFKQYKIQQTTPSVAVFDLFTLYNKRHGYFDIQTVYGSIIRDALQPLSRLRLIRLKNHTAASVIDAHQKARAAKTDYFIHGKYIKGRSFTVIEINLRSTMSGEILVRYRASRRGNSRLYEIAIDFAKKFKENAPLIGRIVKMKQDEIIINLGKNHGIKKGDVFYIIGQLGFRDDFLKKYGRVKKIHYLGQIKINEIDEMLSIGKIINKNTFDSIAMYQYVVFKKKKKK